MTRAAELARALSGRRVQRLADGSYLVPCPVRSHGKGRGDKSPSLRIGDGVSRVLVHCFAGCDSRDVLEELKRRRLIEDRARDSARAANVALTQHLKPQDPDAYARQQHHKAAWLWAHRHPITGSPAEAYLRARGITCQLPPTPGYLPPRKPEHPPAMIAAFALVDEPEPGILGVPRDVQSVHLTLLKPDGSGKADVPKPKIVVGSPCGLPIVLAPPNDLLALAIVEGIEDALSLHQALGIGAWAAYSAGAMPGLADLIPSCIETVTIEMHPDKAGQDGAAELNKRLRRRGVEVFLRGG